MNKAWALAVVLCMLAATVVAVIPPGHDAPAATASGAMHSAEVRRPILDEPSEILMSALSPSSGNGTVSTLVTDRSIVRLADGSDPWQAAAVMQSDGARVVDVIESPFPAVVVEGAFDAAPLGTAFESGCPDSVSFACLSETTGIVGADILWQRQLTKAETNQGDGVVVAVIDTGVWYPHHDLGREFGPGHKVIGGWDFVNNDGDPLDDNGHGTHCAGIVAADGILKGVAPHASILAYKALDQTGYGYTSNIVKAIGAAMNPDGNPDTDDAADIISLSLGSNGYLGDAACIAVEKAVAAGIVVVASAGNKGPAYSTVLSPGISPAVITVGATDNSDALYSASSRGPTTLPEGKPDICAPGVNVNSTVPPIGELGSETGFRKLTGTSMAAPHVAGAAALLLQANPGLTPAQVKALLCQRATPLPYNPLQVGSGRLQVDASADALAFLDSDIDGPFPDSLDIGIEGTGGITVVRNSATLERFLDAGMQSASGTQALTPADDLGVVQGDISMSTSLGLPDPDTLDEGYYSLVVTAEDSAGASRFVRTLFALSVVRLSLVDGGAKLSDSYLTYWAFRNGTYTSSSGMPSYGRTLLLGSGEVRFVAVGGYAFWSQSRPYILSIDIDLARGRENIVALDLAAAEETTIDMSGKWGEPAAIETLVLAFEQDISGVMQTVAASAMSVAGATRPSTWPAGVRVLCGGPVAEPSVLVKAVSFGQSSEFVEANFGVQPDGATGAYGLSPSCYGTATYMMRFPLDDATGHDLSQGAWIRTEHQVPGLLGDPWVTRSQPMTGGGKTDFSIELTPFAQVVTQSPFLMRDVIVNTPFASRYYPGDLAAGMFELGMYVPDWDNATEGDGNTLIPAVRPLPDGIAEVSDLGGAPFSPGEWLTVVDGEAAIQHPLVTDSGGSRVIAKSTPSLAAWKNGAKLYSTTLGEHWWTPAPRRRLSGAEGDITLLVDLDFGSWSPSKARLGASFDTAAGLPPAVRDVQATRRWSPGDTIELSFRVEGVGVPALKVGSGGSWEWVMATQNDGRWYCVFDAPLTGRASFNLSVSGPAGWSFINETGALTPGVQLDVSLETPVEAYDPALAHAAPYTGVLELDGDQLWPGVWVPMTLLVDGEPAGILPDGRWLAGSRILSASRDGSIVLPDVMFDDFGAEIEVRVASGPYSSPQSQLNLVRLNGAVGMLTLDSLETRAGVAESFITLMSSRAGVTSIDLDVACEDGLSAEWGEPPTSLGANNAWSGRLGVRMTVPPSAGLELSLTATVRSFGFVTDVHVIPVREPLFEYDRLVGRTHERFATSLTMSALGLLVGDYSGVLRCLPVEEGQQAFNIFDTGEYWLLGLDTADLDGDGDLDLATGDWEGEVDVYRNSDNWWTHAGKVLDTSGIANLAFGDFDGDGMPDLVVSDLMGSLRVMRNLGGFSFSQWVSIDTNEDFGHFNNQGLAAADVDGDGNCDIVKGYFGKATAYLGDGAGSFTPVVLADQPIGQLMGISPGDVNGDGMTDLAFAYFGDPSGRSGRVVVLINEGNMSFRNTGTIWKGQGAWSVLLHDRDGDGDDDIYLGDDVGGVHALECLSASRPGAPRFEMRTQRRLEPGFNELAVMIRSRNALGSVTLTLRDPSGNRTVDAAVNMGDWRIGLWTVGVWTNDTFLLGVSATDLAGRVWQMPGGEREYLVAWDEPSILSLVISPASKDNCTVRWAVDADDGWLELTLTTEDGVMDWSGTAATLGSHVFPGVSGSVTLLAVLTDAHGGTASAERAAWLEWVGAPIASTPSAEQVEPEPPTGVYVPV